MPAQCVTALTVALVCLGLGWLATPFLLAQRQRVAALLLGIALILAPSSAWAEPAIQSNLDVTLISEVTTVKPGTPFWVAFQIKIRPDWHIYWKNPGDSGAAPLVTWDLPEGFSAGDLVFPYPKRMPIDPLMNFGYSDQVYLLTEIRPAASIGGDRAITLRADGEFLVCRVECIPEQKRVSLTLPVTDQPPTPNPAYGAAFSQTRQAVPQPSPWPATFVAEGKQLMLRLQAPEMKAGQVAEVQFFPSVDGVITNAAPQSWRVDREGLQLTVEQGYQDPLETVEGVLVIQEKMGDQAIARALAIQANPATAATVPANTPAIPLWQTVLLALTGGIILNLMPCVFPVLSLKALTLTQQAHHSPRQARLGGLAFTAGVLVSFALVATILVTLRGLGQTIGWGFQLQSPGFVLVMAYVLFAVALSLSGALTVGASIMGLGQGLAARSGYTGEFFTGVLTTIMATPCTAPFMATAVSVALVQPAPSAIAILLTLGLGLALPYLLLSFTPALRRFLPKPGAWMETFQQVLAFPMYAATAWLVWVLTLQTGTNGLAIALAGIILIGFAAWLYQKTQLTRQGWRRLGTVGALAAIVLALTLTPLVNTSPVASNSSPAQTEAQGVPWQLYTPAQLNQLRQSNQPVFINFTASWCITCLVNERVALSQPEIVSAFASKGVVPVKADWTNQNPDITQALGKFGRSGVPLYLLYPNGLNKGEPTILPQILTPAIVQDALATVTASSTSFN
jgi:thiol:disulfide interchange protein DsbD